MLWTIDCTDKVIAWYKQHLSGKSEYNKMPVGWKDGGKCWSLTVGVGKVDHPGKKEIGVGWSSNIHGKSE